METLFFVILGMATYLIGLLIGYRVGGRSGKEPLARVKEVRDLQRACARKSRQLKRARADLRDANQLRMAAERELGRYADADTYKATVTTIE